MERWTIVVGVGCVGGGDDDEDGVDGGGGGGVYVGKLSSGGVRVELSFV
jgi:hypothetical protein